MRHSSFLAALSCTIGLAACTAEETAPPSDGGGADGAVEEALQTADQSIPMAGTAWLTVGTDGAVQTTLIDADGRYRDMRNGELFGEGTWQQRPNGTICFEPETGVGACWETETTGDNGTLRAVNGDDRRIELKRVTYTPPETAESDDAN